MRIPQMRTPALRNALLVAATAAATSAVVLSATAQVPAPSAAPAPQMVTGLPDFTTLVDAVGPAVVSIEANIGGGAGANQPALEDDEEMPEFFRRFFGPGMPMPQMPPGGRGRGISMGTGFIISADGYVLTNHHVVDGADDVTVRLSDRREFKAKVVGSDAQSDVALLKVSASGLPMLRIGDSRQLRAGQWVVAIGSPFGLDHSVTAGIVSAVGRSNPYANQQYVPFIQTDVAINRGNSGGPLLDTRGQVVGINSQIFSNSGGYMGVSFAIPIEVAMNAVRQLRETGRVVRGQLGVRIQDVERAQLAELGLSRPAGAYVYSVENGSAAFRAGIRPGDVIVRFNGRDIGRSAELPPMVGAMPPGSRASLGLIRDRKPVDVVVTLTALDVAATGGRDTEEAPASAAPASGNALGLAVEPLDAHARAALDLTEGE